MFMFILLSTFLILSRVCIVDDDHNWEFSRSSASIIITKSIHGHALYTESDFYGSFVQPPRRRLLEHPRWIKQVYRGNDYNLVRRRHQPRDKLEEGRFYRSAVKDDEDDDEDEEEEEEEEEDESEKANKINDEDADEETEEETEEQDQNEEETVAAAVGSGSRYRVARSDYVPFWDKVGERERQEAVRIRSVTEVCEDESTESPQYYEYETEMRNVVASQEGDTRRGIFLAKILCATFLILLLV